MLCSNSKVLFNPNELNFNKVDCVMPTLLFSQSELTSYNLKMQRDFFATNFRDGDFSIIYDRLDGAAKETNSQ